MDAKIGAVLERLFSEVIALRKENGTLRNNKRPTIAEGVLPRSPFKEKHAFMEFEKDLGSSSEKQQLLVSELEAINILNVDKCLRTYWRKIITDEVAELFSWKGTGTKCNAIGLATTAAIRSTDYNIIYYHFLFNSIFRFPMEFNL
ncbi:PREDICTED: uncharacterized protein LOC108360172 isoform X1 [Rhagoletis zephyria]|uniref:uncharacterized protein LOC108360172 isoform X1 n=2 Tax=Rhagoletis zephyria TaxID=28612 RepID=UPI0008114580|nr:PREDICTED: uncharacterized protein LOC108360172 isoform X1 [Rhagoletis zephyria]